MVGRVLISDLRASNYTKMRSPEHRLFYGMAPWVFLKLKLQVREHLPLLKQLQTVLLFQLLVVVTA